MKFLLSGVIVVVGLFPINAQAQQKPSNTEQMKIAAMVEALRLAAPKTNSNNDGLYSEWKVKPETAKGWSKYCLKKEIEPTQFADNKELARQIISCIMERELKQQLKATNNNETQAVGRVACWWMTGRYTGCNSGFTKNYVEKVVGNYQKQRSVPPSNSDSPKSESSSN